MPRWRGGPKGRTAAAATDVTLRAEVLSYSRSRGLFAGISLEGSTVRPDNDANERVYGKKLEAESIVFKGAVAVPPPAQRLGRPEPEIAQELRACSTPQRNK